MGGGSRRGGRGETLRDKYMAWHVGQVLMDSFRNCIISPEVLAPPAEVEGKERGEDKQGQTKGPRQAT